MKKFRLWLRAVIVLSLVGLLAWSLQQGRKAAPVTPVGVSRAEVLALAERYVHHPWTPGPQHTFHGVDAAGVRVDTPDLTHKAKNSQGWWVVGAQNVGIPYKWGGFDLPEEFDAGLQAGRYAGDCGSAEKRRLLDDAVSNQAVGIDCSGFVSRCWRLPRSYSTRELPQLCDPVTDLTQLRPGDIFNRHNAHVMIFAEWVDPAHTTMAVYEADERVRRNERALAPLLAEGFTAWRYRAIHD